MSKTLKALDGDVDVALVRKLVAEVEAISGDDETAHSMEDDIHQGVLRAIVEGRCCDDPREVAAEALKTTKLDFARWCA